jgi:uncharacterized protein
MVLQISLTIAAAAAILNIWLSIRIGAIRTKEKISIGDGGHEPLIRRMRAQANFLENTPFALILFAAIELATGFQTWLWILGAVYILGRIAHAIGMDGVSGARIFGTLTTMLSLLILAIYAIYLVYSRAGMA